MEAARASHIPAPGVTVTAAPFRAWRGSRLTVARGPTRTTIVRLGILDRRRGRRPEKIPDPGPGCLVRARIIAESRPVSGMRRTPECLAKRRPGGSPGQRTFRQADEAPTRPDGPSLDLPAGRRRQASKRALSPLQRHPYETSAPGPCRPRRGSQLPSRVLSRGRMRPLAL